MYNPYIIPDQIQIPQFPQKQHSDHLTIQDLI